jgi:hypothetical protein
MRIVLSLFLLLAVSTGVRAQTQIDRIDIGEYGIFTADTTNTTLAPGAVTTQNTVRNVRLAVTTRTIPAQPGVRFGFRYTVVGAPAGTKVQLHMVTIFPAPGLTDPATQKSATRYEYDIDRTIGTEQYTGYNFDDAWEAVPGVWTFQIWDQGRKLAEQTFTVVKQ